MVTREDIEEVLIDKVSKRFEDPSVADKFKGFSKTIQLTFPDLEISYVMKITNGKFDELVEGTLENPDIHVTANSDILVGIIRKEIGAMRAYMTRKIKVKGSMSDLLKLQKLLF
ncbi:MAG: SCP2 sterol-binding domain-containing protein [Promethearchaeota archaeon]